MANKLIGKNPEQIPTNNMLGSMAFQSREAVSVGGIYTDAGTAALPSHAFSADRASGIWQPATSAIALSTAGSERMRIDASGNLGIGTSSPTEKLHVAGNIYAGTVTYYQTLNGSGLTVVTPSGASGSVRLIQTGIYDWSISNVATTGALSIGNYMYVSTSGNVGIGTSSPSVKFVASNGGANGYELDPVNGFISAYNRSTSSWTKITTRASSYTFNLSNSNDAVNIDSSGNVGIGTASPAVKLAVDGGAATAIALFTSSSATNGYIRVANTAAGGSSLDLASGAAGHYVFGNSTIPLVFGTNGNERMRIDSSGNVVIGATSGTFRLQVETNSDANAGAYVRNSSTGTSAAGVAVVASAVGSISMRSHSAAHSVWPNSTLIQSDSGFTGGLNILQAGANPIILWTNSTERMRIDSSGNVGIGTASPNAAARLDVSSTTSGFLPPRMTTAQRDAITSPPNGLMLYNTSTDKLQVRAAGAWVDLH